MTRRLLSTLVGIVCLVAGSGGGAMAQADPQSPAADADGQPWIAYYGDQGTRLVHPDGTGDHVIAADFKGSLILADWSPDGQRLVMTSRDTGGTEPLYEYELASDTYRQVFECEYPACLGDDEPAYSRDGTQLVFSRALGPFEDDAPADCGIWTGDPMSGEVRQITSNPGCDREYFPRWSPDGSRLTYWRWHEDAGGTTGTAVFVIDADGTNEQQLTEWDTFAGEADWSPDGEWIVYASHPLEAFNFQGGVVSNLYRMHPDGTETEQLTLNTEPTERATQPRYTPDGESIIYTAVVPDARELWVMPADGGEPYAVSKGGIHTHGTWQPAPPSP